MSTYTRKVATELAFDPQALATVIKRRSIAEVQVEALVDDLLADVREELVAWGQSVLTAAYPDEVVPGI